MAAPAANPPWRLRSIVFELLLGADLVTLNKPETPRSLQLLRASLTVGDVKR